MLAKLFLSIALMSVTLQVKKPSAYYPDKSVLATCSGVFIGPNEVLTAGHCFKNYKDAWIKDHYERSFHVVLVHVDFEKDLALVRVERMPPTPFYAKLQNSYDKLDQVFIVSAADGMRETYSYGYIHNFHIEEGQHLIVHSAGILPGSSGSGLFDKMGRLIGINTMMYKTASYAVDMADIQAFLFEAYAKQLQMLQL